MNQRYQLSHADASRIIDAIQSELEKENKGAAIAVTDEHGELKPENSESSITDRPDNEYLPELAADVISNLVIHFLPNLGGQTPVLGHETRQPGQYVFLVF